MSDSVDRVFVHALQTVRRLPRTGSSRPPPASRLRLYGLYKQSMEGDVLSILQRPTLPPSSPDPASSNVHRYASKDLRDREAQAEIEKWDAWHACAGMSRTEAKRRYIEALIETMKAYASGTQESRELVSELEFVWAQIRNQSGSSEENGSGGDAESPTRRLQRAGLHQAESYASLPPGRIGSGDSGGAGGGRPPPYSQTGAALRVLSPIGRTGSDDIVEGEDADLPESPAQNQDLDDAEEEPYRDASESQTPQRRTPSPRDLEWKRRIESALTKMSTELAALREQMAESRVFPTPASRRRSGMLAWMKWLIWAAMRQIAVDVVLLLLTLLWGRWRGDRRAEEWVKRRWKDVHLAIRRLDVRRSRWRLF